MVCLSLAVQRGRAMAIAPMPLGGNVASKHVE